MDSQICSLTKTSVGEVNLQSEPLVSHSIFQPCASTGTASIDAALPGASTKAVLVDSWKCTARPWLNPLRPTSNLLHPSTFNNDTTNDEATSKDKTNANVASDVMKRWGTEEVRAEPFNTIGEVKQLGVRILEDKAKKHESSETGATAGST